VKERPYRLSPAAADDLDSIVGYLVFYREAADDHIDIIRVLHSARELEKILLGDE
jgi:plasmid stabilization system protein ParE